MTNKQTAARTRAARLRQAAAGGGPSLVSLPSPPPPPPRAWPLRFLAARILGRSASRRSSFSSSATRAPSL